MSHTLEAGPELDALVADAIGSPMPPKVEGRYARGERDGFWYNAGNTWTCPEFSTDWNAAMEALESLIVGSDWKIGGYEVSWPDGLTEDRSLHECRIGPWSLNTPGKKDGPLASATAPTGPLAICRAILAAKESR